MFIRHPLTAFGRNWIDVRSWMLHEKRELRPIETHCPVSNFRTRSALEGFTNECLPERRSHLVAASHLVLQTSPHRHALPSLRRHADIGWRSAHSTRAQGPEITADLPQRLAAAACDAARARSTHDSHT